jgi:hypothetical protein
MVPSGGEWRAPQAHEEESMTAARPELRVKAKVAA